MTTTEQSFDFSESEIQQMLANLDNFDADEVQEIDKLVNELNGRRRGSFTRRSLAYVDIS